MLSPSEAWPESRDHLNFWQKVAISQKTLQDSDMVTMVPISYFICDLSNGDIADDLE